jgi:flavin-dependent dehydrogenase
MKITVVGGGTAGWIAAYFIAKAQPGKHQIHVVESSKIGIIGAGEGSTGSMVDLLNGGFFKYKSNIDKFIEKTDATPKMGIYHRWWNKKKESYFAPLDASPTGFTINDYIFKHVLSSYKKEKMHLASNIGVQYENGNYDYYAFHFDGHKVGKFFRDECSVDGVKTYDAVVNKVNLNSSSGDIESIVLDDGYVLESDFFIDCTGFSRVLMKAVGDSWISRADVLPMNTAMPFLVDYGKDEKIMPHTAATALSSGWMWNIPLRTRRGCGYVYDSSFISKEDARAEIEKLLGKEIQPIKYIEFIGGYSSNFWKNNVICLGLSSSFVEPLEATSIHNTIVQVAMFVNECLDLTKDTTCVQVKKDIYNKRIRFLNELTVDFISLHYQGGRDDTEFWKYIAKNSVMTDNARTIVEQAQYKIPGYTSMEGMYGSFSIPLANWILAGLDIITPKMAEKELSNESRMLFAREQYEMFYAKASGYNHMSSGSIQA